VTLITTSLISVTLMCLMYIVVRTSLFVPRVSYALCFQKRKKARHLELKHFSDVSSYIGLIQAFSLLVSSGRCLQTGGRVCRNMEM
jgi:hypothetical protein